MAIHSMACIATMNSCTKPPWVLKGCNRNAFFHSHLASITNNSASHLQLQCEYATHPAAQAAAKPWSLSSQARTDTLSSPELQPGQLFRGDDIMACSERIPLKQAAFSELGTAYLLCFSSSGRDNTNVPTLPWIAWVIEVLDVTKKMDCVILSVRIAYIKICGF